jgi:hypothetical protein
VACAGDIGFLVGRYSTNYVEMNDFMRLLRSGYLNVVRLFSTEAGDARYCHNRANVDNGALKTTSETDC